MNFSNVLKTAYRSLSRNKLRSLLTMLGIVIGVAAVIAMLGIGQGARDAVQSQIAALGTNVLIIFPGAVNQGGVRFEAGSSAKLTEEDAIALGQQCPAVKYVSPLARTSAQVVAGAANWRTSISGVYPEYFPIRDWQVESGNYFTAGDERAAAKVCLLGRTVSNNLFGENVDPTGQTVRIRSIPFKVIGLLASKGQNVMGQDQDDLIAAPFSTVQRRLMGVTFAQMITVSAQSATAVAEAKDEISQVLRSRHKIASPSDDDFTIRTQTDLASAAGAASQILTVLLASIASVSLLVGGIGIMNIMLVSVTERTREIGLRLAVGAKGRDVLLQFLVESLLLSFFGGILGVFLGVGVSRILTTTQGWSVTLAPASILLSFGFAAAIGVFFGWYPARKAAALNPIDALRYE
jgi:putative ABC transport system permease protein